MAILVTGGAGYIGSHTVRAIRAAGHDVVVLDTLELGSKEAVLDTPLVVGDIADEDLVHDVCVDYKVTAVLHFAAYKNVGESMSQPGRYFRNNVDGTVRLLEATRRAGVEQIVFSSSCSVNGTPDSVPVTEDAPIHPESVYAETKAMVERILRWYGVVHGVRAVSLRYFNAAGASSDAVIGENWDHSQNLVPLVMKALLVGEPVLKVFGADYSTPDGTCVRDYIHVDDLADAHVAAFDYLVGGGTTIELNVGTGIGSSVFEVLRCAEDVTGRPVPYEVVDRRAGDPVATFADPSRAAQVLGWRARHDLRHILESAYRWHESRAGHSDG
jgi:UDP-glucose 4-epimerase